MEYINGSELQFDNDQIAIINGDPFTGLAFYYRDDGTIESEVDYVQGIQEGVIRDFDELGNVISESEVKNGAYHGQV
ncbi:MAG: hypothetical protein SVR94_15305, partial [Pseudomonadota bacterium]|nr:hypothetical protein [Pseudomonadota bacterium]